ncbi:MAG TPA: hypothetical protein PLO56_06665 [Rhodothermales bacterium]|nr:hypothetical protein [Rhodothermales bacterium]
MRPLLLLILLLLSPLLRAQAVLENPTFRMQLDGRGRVLSLFDKTQRHEYAYRDTASVLMQVRDIDHIWHAPSAMKWNARNKVLSLFFRPSRIRVDIRVEQKSTHLVFEVTKAMPTVQIDRVLWGSFTTTIQETIGEIVGVVRNGQFAIGIQALNLKTIGGYPKNDEGYDGSRGSTALPTRWGSTLQAYSINRSRTRLADVWNGAFKNMPIEPLEKETVTGSKIALFGVPAGEALDTIGAIEQAEGLPHPVYKGVWIKKSPQMGRSYIISNFDEGQVDEMIAHTKRAGLMSLYHEGPFKTWGTYDWNPLFFPNGTAGVKRAVEKAHAADIHFGVHTLTNFINPTDPYVSPTPDKRLVKRGSSALTEAITADATIIPIASPEYFDYNQDNWLRLVRIGDELIRYRAVSKTAPYQLLDCQRGAFGSTATAHPKTAEIAKLFDHAYEVVFPNLSLQYEIARNLAQLFNDTGIDHLDFDGHEGGAASGQGDYGIEAFSKVFYDNTKHFVVNGTSNSKHFYWHMNTYCNWGEPWYGGFRESMQEYRIKNQSLFERNFMPNMLGWYLMTATTSLTEMEWMLARTAGYKAGFAMVLRVNDAQKNPLTPTLLDAIREWEQARLSHAFSDEQRERLKNPENEFHLRKIASNQWELYPFYWSPFFRHQKRDLQPGEPTANTFEVINHNESQPLQFRLEVLAPTTESGASSSIENPVLVLNRSAELRLPVSLQPNESVVVDGTPLVRVYDEKGRQRATLTLPLTPPSLINGLNQISLDASFRGETYSVMQIRFKTKGAPEGVQPR